MTIRKLPGSQIESNTITITQIQTTAVTNIVAQSGPRANSLIYPGNDTAGNTVGGQTVYINGSGFEPNNAIYINGNTVPSKAFISASNLSFTTPALAAGIYPVYLINTDSGATAIFIPGYISSAEPSWVTSASIDAVETWSINLSATGDAPVTYALAGGSSLPSGISLAANGLISGTMSSPPENDTQYLFTVVASDAQNQDASRQFTVTVSVGEGVLFANNVLLIHADGTNNQNNHTFLDSSNNNFTITRAGNATQGSFSPFSQTGWSGYFDGNGDSLTYTGGGSSINFGTSDFTIELFVNMANTGTYSAFLRPDDNGIFPEFGYDWSTGQLKFDARNGAIANATTSITPNAWRHIAASRSGTSLRLFVDGTQVGTTVTNSTNFASTSGTIRIGGSDYSATHCVNGYISNFRILKGTALYTANSSPPTAALTNIANTSLLTLQSNRFIDNSNNNFAITRNGGVSIQAFSPFAPTASYSTANVGGSGYFDGIGDNLQITYSSTMAAGTGPYSFEAWVYFTSSGDNQGVIGTTSDGFAGFEKGVTNWAYYYGTGGATTSTLVVSNQWNHVVVCRNGSGAGAFFVNGIRIATFTDNANKANFGNLQIGYNGVAGGGYTTGYISEYRYVKGNPYDPTLSALTVPTTPLTAIANTVALLNYTNAGIFDQTAKTVLETVGDAKVSTAQYKYGTGSMYFDGTGDYLIAPNNSLWIMSGDWTIEAWIYPANVTGVHVVVDTRNRTQSVTSPVMYTNGTSLVIDTGAGVVVSAGTITVNTWQHVAATRSANSWRLFINGTQVGNTTSNTTAYSVAYGCCIGTSYFNEHFNGYIDDLRITKGYARYTSTFTPPTSALKDK